MLSLLKKTKEVNVVKEDLLSHYHRLCDDLKKYREEYVFLQNYHDPCDEYVINRLRTIKLILDDLKQQVLTIRKELL